MRGENDKAFSATEWLQKDGDLLYALIIGLS